MSYAKLLNAMKSGPGKGNWGHAGRPGLVGGSQPQTSYKGGSGSGNFNHSGRPGKRGGSGPGMNSTFAGYSDALDDLASSLNIDDVRRWHSMSNDERFDLYHDNKSEYDRLKALDDTFKEFKLPTDHPLTEHLGVGQVKNILNRMAQPALSDKELSKLPTKDNYKAWMWQKYGVVANELSGDNAKRYAEAMNDVAAKHGLVGGFFLTGVDAAWQKSGEKGGDFDSAYATIHVPTRLSKGGQSQDAKDVFTHEYGHYLDAYVLGKPNITVQRARGFRGDVAVMRKDSREGWLTIKQAESMGYSKEPKPGWVQYDAGGTKRTTSSWYRDPDKIKQLRYKDYTPHELLAEMFEDHMSGRLSMGQYSDSELAWFNTQVLPNL